MSSNTPNKRPNPPAPEAAADCAIAPVPGPSHLESPAAAPTEHGRAAAQRRPAIPEFTGTACGSRSTRPTGVR